MFDDNITKSCLGKKESVDVKNLDGIEKESNLIPKVNPKKSKTVFFYLFENAAFICKFIKFLENHNTQPSYGVKNCLYKLRSVVHRDFCLVSKEHGRKKNERIITTDLPYLAQLPCDSVNEEEQWARRDKHICSDKNDMCLTVLPNLKDGGVYVNLMAYEESAK